MIVACGGLKFLKCFHRADDGAVLIVNRNSVDANRNFVSGLVVQEPDAFSGVRGFDRACDRAVFFAELTAWLIAVQQTFGDAGVPDDLVTEMASDALRSIAPEYDFFLHVDDGESGRQAIENAATDVRVME